MNGDPDYGKIVSAPEPSNADDPDETSDASSLVFYRSVLISSKYIFTVECLLNFKSASIKNELQFTFLSLYFVQ